MKNFAFLIISSVAIMACSSNKIINIDDKKEIELSSKVNEVSKVKLETNPSTGYSWDIKLVEDNSHLVINTSYENTTNDVNIIGSPLYQIIEMKPLEKGNYVIKLEYKRGWETGSSVDEKTIRLKVE